MPGLQTYTNIIAGFMIASWGVVLLFAIAWFVEWKRSTLSSFLETYGPTFLILFPLAGIIGSLIYSYGFHLPPCELCWWQRIFLYPLFFFGLTMWIEKKRAWLFPAVISTIGSLIGLYHYLLHRSVFASSVFCGGQGGVDCAKIDVQAFGFVTIPLLSLTLFVFLAIMCWYLFIKNRKQA